MEVVRRKVGWDIRCKLMDYLIPNGFETKVELSDKRKVVYILCWNNYLDIEEYELRAVNSGAGSEKEAKARFSNFKSRMTKKSIYPEDLLAQVENAGLIPEVADFENFKIKLVQLKKNVIPNGHRKNKSSENEIPQYPNTNDTFQGLLSSFESKEETVNGLSSRDTTMALLEIVKTAARENASLDSKWATLSLKIIEKEIWDKHITFTPREYKEVMDGLDKSLLEDFKKREIQIVGDPKDFFTIYGEKNV